MMKHNHDGDGDDWLDNLEAIIAGNVPSSDEENEELLHVATRLASALAPLYAIKAELDEAANSACTLASETTCRCFAAPGLCHGYNQL
jgi:hypothetical protein